MDKVTRITAMTGLIVGLFLAAVTASLAAKPVDKGPNAKSESVISAELSLDFISVTVTSTKELSNVVMLFCDGAVEKVEFVDGDLLQELIDGLWTATVSGSGEHEGVAIASVWVKSGSFRSDDGPGYGGMIAFLGTCNGGESLS